MFLFDFFGRSFLMTTLAGASVMSVGGMAYTAANTVPTTVAGSGSGTVSGYTVTNLTYTLAANPQNVASVSFTLSASGATKVRVSGDGGTTWFNCDSAISGANVSACATSGLAISSMSSLTIVATE
ncbi:MAG: hypothetical protein FJ037_05380 [Chloroflexi bacterium]|nr:hypothetical protein [Chloroflexota bacterium]